VRPILEVLVGKTIEQSLVEVMEEEELAELRKQQREFEELRNAEKVEQQRLEEQERRLREEKHRRMKQAADVLRLEKETAEKLAAKAFAKSYLADLVPSVFNNLRENGYFYDPVQRDLETGFMPWVMESTLEALAACSVGRLLLDSLIRDCVARRDGQFKDIIEYFRDMEGDGAMSALEQNNNSVLPAELLVNDEPETSNPTDDANNAEVGGGQRLG